MGKTVNKCCRNCRWATWSKTRNGRRRFNYAAYCAAPLDNVLSRLPAAARDSYKELLNPENMRVFHDDKSLKCPAWVRYKPELTNYPNQYKNGKKQTTDSKG